MYVHVESYDNTYMYMYMLHVFCISPTEKCIMHSYESNQLEFSTPPPIPLALFPDSPFTHILTFYHVIYTKKRI